LALLLAVALLLAADTPDRLPPLWSKLGLSADQKAKAVAVQEKYRTQIEDLRQKIRLLEKKERQELADLLTDGQRAKLKQFTEGKP
jgi:hypothetical protein